MCCCTCKLRLGRENLRFCLCNGRKLLPDERHLHAFVCYVRFCHSVLQINYSKLDKIQGTWITYPSDMINYAL